MSPLKITAKCNWKEVDIDPNNEFGFGGPGEMCLEELVDYDLPSSKKKNKNEKLSQKKKKMEKSIKVNDDDSTSKKNKKKRKKPKKKDANKSLEVTSKTEDASDENLKSQDVNMNKTDTTGKQKLKKKKNKKKNKSTVGRTFKTSGVIDMGQIMEEEMAADAIKQKDKDREVQVNDSRKRKLKEEKKEHKKEAKKAKLDAGSSGKLGQQQKDDEEEEESLDEDDDEETSGIESSGEEKLKETEPVDMSAWANLYVPAPVEKALAELGFTTPTPIQDLTLASAIRDKMDIVGAAETGSGKTLAFGIPLLHHILKEKEKARQKAAAGDVDEEDEDEDDDDDEEELSDLGEDPEFMEDLEEVDESDIDNDDEDDDNEDDEDEDDDDEEDSDPGEDLEFLEEVTEEDVEGKEEDEDSGDQQFSDVSFDDDEAKEEEDNEDDLDSEALSGEEETCPELGENQLGCVKVVNFGRSGFPGKKKGVPVKKPLYALVLTPTRELAVQVKNHLQAAAKYTDIYVGVVVGGMSSQKQERVLSKGPEIVVATPGRLWELITGCNPHLSQVENIRHLVIDEADRMVEKGHFQELSSLLEMINSNKEAHKKRQSFVFSATLTLIHKGPNRPMKKKKVSMTQDQKIESLMRHVGIKDKPKVVDITRKVGTAETLTEARINCTTDEKDLYLYYFLFSYPERTLVFCNSKDCLRRLTSIFTLLKCKPLPLHADMHQKQRLKNLEKFSSDPKALLIATDVAARGLDIPNVQHVIHYQVPKTSENYVHRSGRTARALKEGLSIMLVGQEDASNYRKIVKTLNRDEELPIFPVEQNTVAALKPRVSLALLVDKEEHIFNKKKHSNNWFEKMAEEMDIELDERNLLHNLGNNQEVKLKEQRLKAMRADLKRLLNSSVTALGFSGKYITKTGKLVTPYSQVKVTCNPIVAVQRDKKSMEAKEQQQQVKAKKRKRNWMNKKKKKGEKAADKV